MTAVQQKTTDGKSSMLSRIASADKTAVEECMDFYGAMIWTMANRFAASDSKVKRMTQDIFTDIWRNAESANLSFDDEKLWIALIARRCLKKHATRH